MMSGGRYFECIFIYSALDIGVSKKKNFRLQDINLALSHASGIVILKISLGSKIYAAVDGISAGYSSLYPPTVSLTL